MCRPAKLFVPHPGCCALPEMPEVLFQGVSRVHRCYVGQGEVLQLGEVSKSRPLQNKKKQRTKAEQTVSHSGADEELSKAMLVKEHLC